MRLAPFRTAAVLIIALGLAPDADDQDGYKPLVKGDDPKQFELVAIGPDTLTIEDGEVRVSGHPNGYFATKDSYKNFVLKFEWMYERPLSLTSDAEFAGNSGLLVNIETPHKVWPRSTEFQLMNREVGKVYNIGGAKFDGTWDPDAYKKAIKPVGEWNQEEVTSKGGAMTCTLNGVEVTRGTGASPNHGQIGWQSEGVPIRFRNLRIKTLD